MKHWKTRLHKDLSTSVFHRYCVENPQSVQIEDILKTRL